MTASTENDQIAPPTPEIDNIAAVATPTRAKTAGFGNLDLEIGSDYLIWSIAGRRLFGSKRTSGGAIANSLLRDPLVLLERIAEIVDNHGLRQGSVNLYLSLPEAMLRSLYVPVVPKNELTQVVVWEANKVFPFALQGELFDWRIVNTVEWRGAKKYQIQAAGVIAFKVYAVCEELSGKGLNVKRITLTSLAWEPLVAQLAGKTAATCMAIVRLLGSRLSVYFYNDGALEFVRDNVIETGYGATEFDFSLRYLDGSMPAPLEDQLSHSNVDPEAIAKTVTDDLEFYYGRFSQRTVEAIVLAAPEPKYKTIADALREALGVDVFSAFDDCAGRDTGSAIPRNLLMPSICRRPPRGKSLNLLPPEYLGVRREKTRFKLSVYGAALLLVLLVTISLFQHMRLGNLVGEETQLRHTLDALRHSVAYNEIVSQTNEKTQWQAVSSDHRRAAPEHSRILRALSHYTPSDIFLTNINLQSTTNASGQSVNSVSIAGFVVDTGQQAELRLAQYLKTLVNFPCSQKVELNNQNTTISNLGKRLEFGISLELVSCGN